MLVHNLQAAFPQCHVPECTLALRGLRGLLVTLFLLGGALCEKPFINKVFYCRPDRLFKPLFESVKGRLVLTCHRAPNQNPDQAAPGSCDNLADGAAA